MALLSYLAAFAVMIVAFASPGEVDLVCEAVTGGGPASARRHAANQTSAAPHLLLRRLSHAPIVASLALQPIEEQLSVGSARFLRTVRRWLRRFFRTVSWSVQQWTNWTLSAVGMVLIALLAPLLDRQLVETWKRHGFGVFRVSVLLALAVYVRLLLDRRSPLIGKALLTFAVLCGVAPNDLLPDRLSGLGLIDDLVLVGLASRIFTRLCPDGLVEQHAVEAAKAWERATRSRIPSGALPES